MKLLAIGASTSSTSINERLAAYAARLVPDSQITVFSLRDLTLPIYSEDEEKGNGHPADAHKFLDAIAAHDGIVLSLAEHNGSYAAAFKNIYDWASRIEQKVWQDKPMLLLSTSPGGRGGATVLEAGKATFARMGANLAASFSLPSFYDNFSESGISDPELASELKEAVDVFSTTITNN